MQRLKESGGPCGMCAICDGCSRVLFCSRQFPRKIWQDAHDDARAHSHEAIALMAQRQNMTVREFQWAEQGLVCASLRQQQFLMAPCGLLARSLQRVQQVQRQLKLLSSGAVLARVTNRPIQEALR